MTQAINLANFANSLDTSGQVPPTQLNAPVPISKGGTNATTAAAARNNLDVAQAVYSVPSGGIIMWSGSVGSIPTGWFLCDGNNSTPNLTDRFIVGAGSVYTPGDSGGSADAVVVNHTHTATSTVTDPGHNHSYPLGEGYYNTTVSPAIPTNTYSSRQTNTPNTGSKTTGITVATSNTATGVSGTNANLPPYYALAFIMKS